MTIILEGIVGSQAYGLATPDSDEDRLAVHQVPTMLLFGLDQPKETMRETDPDWTSHELRKFVTLCLKGNPTVNELLWLDPEGYTVMTEVGEKLIRIRHLFVSAEMIGRYIGYCSSQAQRIVRGTKPKEAGKVAKNGRHCFRLLYQAESLITTGLVRVRLDVVERANVMAVGRVAEENPQEFLAAVEDKIAQVKALGHDLPPHPRRELVDAWLEQVRLDQLMTMLRPA